MQAISIFDVVSLALSGYLEHNRFSIEKGVLDKIHESCDTLDVICGKSHGNIQSIDVDIEDDTGFINLSIDTETGVTIKDSEIDILSDCSRFDILPSKTGSVNFTISFDTGFTD